MAIKFHRRVQFVRCNFDRLPYHLLYDLKDNSIRVWVVRHDHRHPGFGMGRFSR